MYTSLSLSPCLILISYPPRATTNSSEELTVSSLSLPRSSFFKLRFLPVDNDNDDSPLATIYHYDVNMDDINVAPGKSPTPPIHLLAKVWDQARNTNSTLRDFFETVSSRLSLPSPRINKKADLISWVSRAGCFGRNEERLLACSVEEGRIRVGSSRGREVGVQSRVSFPVLPPLFFDSSSHPLVPSFAGSSRKEINILSVEGGTSRSRSSSRSRFEIQSRRF